MANRKRSGTERRKSICIEGWRVESRDNPVAS